MIFVLNRDFSLILVILVLNVDDVIKTRGVYDADLQAKLDGFDRVQTYKQIQ